MSRLTSYTNLLLFLLSHQSFSWPTSLSPLPTFFPTRLILYGSHLISSVIVFSLHSSLYQKSVLQKAVISQLYYVECLILGKQLLQISVMLGVSKDTSFQGNICSSGVQTDVLENVFNFWEFCKSSTIPLIKN